MMDRHTWWDFANCSRMPTIALVAIRALDEDGRIAEAFSEDLAANVVKSNTLADVSPGLFHHRIPIDVGEETEAEALRVARVRKTVHRNGGLRCVEGLADPRI